MILALRIVSDRRLKSFNIVQIKVIGDCFSYFRFCTDNSFLCKNESKRNNFQ